MKKLGFGLMRLPLLDPKDMKSVDMPQLCDMVDVFLERGFTYFDTAYMYHGGRSETAIREALVARYPRDTFILTTKLPVMFLKKREDLERIFTEQLQKCGVEYFDYYLLHNLNTPHLKIAETLDCFDFLEEKKREGKILHTGFSYHDHAGLLDEILTAHPEMEVVQVQMNYLDWENEGIQSRKCYEVAREHHKPVIAMEPVKGGMLAKVPEQAAQWFDRGNPGMSPSSWALRFAAGHEGVFTVLSGMSDRQQMLENTDLMHSFEPLGEEENKILQQVVSLMNEENRIPCTFCRYCTDVCPNDIAIPEYFALYNTEKQVGKTVFSTQRVYYDNYTRNHGKASDCSVCKSCEEVCPQHIEISHWLEEVAGTFEVPLPKL